MESATGKQTSPHSIPRPPVGGPSCLTVALFSNFWLIYLLYSVNYCTDYWVSWHFDEKWQRVSWFLVTNIFFKKPGIFGHKIVKRGQSAWSLHWKRTIPDLCCCSNCCRGNQCLVAMVIFLPNTVLVLFVLQNYCIPYSLVCSISFGLLYMILTA